jgi:ribonuclease P/MRP protein subunit RPP1
MTLADACTHPYPAGDSSAKRMALEAGELGFDTVIAIGSGGFSCSGVRVLRGVLIQESVAKRVLERVRRCPAGTDIVIVDAGDPGFNRAVLSMRGIHILRHIQKTQKNSFDHIAARAAADHRIAVDLDLRPVIHTRGVERQRVLGRYAMILRLQRHYRFPLTLSSNARSILEQRSIRDFVRLCSLFGMEEPEVREALAAVDDLIRPRGPVQVVE